MPLHKLDELVYFDHATVVFVDLLHNLLDFLRIVIEPQGFHQIRELNLIDCLDQGRCTLEWLVSKI